MGVIWESFGDNLKIIWASSVIDLSIICKLFGDHLKVIWQSFVGKANPLNLQKEVIGQGSFQTVVKLEVVRKS